ncbi:MAG TPA: hypothetical protein VFJ85_02720 [Acidimicrobiales bacterium]|nr:hypothetical protein [Acidimicrobiales bacterium]
METPPSTARRGAAVAGGLAALTVPMAAQWISEAARSGAPGGLGERLLGAGRPLPASLVGLAAVVVALRLPACDALAGRRTVALGLAAAGMAPAVAVLAWGTLARPGSPGGLIAALVGPIPQFCLSVVVLGVAVLRPRLEAVTAGALTLACAAPLIVAAWVGRELRNPFNRRNLPAVEWPFAYGAPREIAALALAAAVLLLLVPPSSRFGRHRAAARLLVMMTLAADLALTAGYLWTRFSWDRAHPRAWGGPQGYELVVYQLPAALVCAVVLCFLLRHGRPAPA